MMQSFEIIHVNAFPPDFRMKALKPIWELCRQEGGCTDIYREGLSQDEKYLCAYGNRPHSAGTPGIFEDEHFINALESNHFVEACDIDWSRMTYKTFRHHFRLVKPAKCTKRARLLRIPCGDYFIVIRNRRAIIRMRPYCDVNYSDDISCYSILLMMVPWRSEIDLLGGYKEGSNTVAVLSPVEALEKARIRGDISISSLNALDHKASLNEARKKARSYRPSPADGVEEDGGIGVGSFPINKGILMLKRVSILYFYTFIP